MANPFQNVFVSRRYALGRDCELEIDGELIDTVSDVVVRELTNEVDATPFNSAGRRTIATGRSYEIGLVIREITTARKLFGKRQAAVGGFVLPNIVLVSLLGGLVSVTNRRFTIHDVDGDEPLDGCIESRFVLKEWSDE